MARLVDKAVGWAKHQVDEFGRACGDMNSWLLCWRASGDVDIIQVRRDGELALVHPCITEARPLASS